MEQSVNKVNEEVAKWNQSEKEHLALYPEIVNSPSFVKTRLHQLNIIKARFKNSNDPAHKTSILFLNLEIARLSPPSRKFLGIPIPPKGQFLTWLVNKVVKAIKYELIAAKLNKVEKQNSEKFIRSFEQSGFGKYTDQVAQMIKQGKKAFSINVPYQREGNEVTNFKLNINYDELNGHSLKNVQAAHYNKLNPAVVRNHQFAKLADTSTPRSLANLMAGRPVGEEFTRNGVLKTQWRQFDLTDKDANGNYRTITLPDDDFDLKRVLKNSPIWKKLSPGHQIKATEALMHGDRHEINFVHQGEKIKIFLEANPLKKELIASNDKGKPLSLNKVFTQQQTNTVQTNMAVVKSPGMQKAQVEKQVAKQDQEKLANRRKVKVRVK